MKLSIHEKIKLYRENRTMTQAELSKRSGINLSTIKKYETGILNPKPENLKKIADALNVSIYLFLDYEVTTLSDAIAIFMKLTDAIPVQFSGEKLKQFNENPADLSVIFNNPAFNSIIFQYLKSQYNVQLLQDHPELESSGNTLQDAVLAAESIKLSLPLTSMPISAANTSKKE